MQGETDTANEDRFNQACDFDLTTSVGKASKFLIKLEDLITSSLTQGYFNKRPYFTNNHYKSLSKIKQYILEKNKVPGAIMIDNVLFNDLGEAFVSDIEALPFKIRLVIAPRWGRSVFEIYNPDESGY